MSNRHEAMWKALGIDVEAHDVLLKALGSMYRDFYLSQKNRPSGMGYFDHVVSEIHGQRIQELVEAKAHGRKVVGSFCLYVPEEIILAADAISVGLCAGAEVGTQAAERVLPRNTCALIKSFMGFKLDRICPYVEACDLVIGETTCDGKTKAYEIFNEYKETFVLQLPRVKSEEGKALWRSEVRRLAAKVEELTGKEIGTKELAAAIRTVNAKRRAIHRLSTARAGEPSPVSGLDALLINQVQFYDDPARFTRSVEALCDELEGRVEKGAGVAPAGAPRILVAGCPMAAPNWKLHHVIEKCGAVVVGEESCVGERGTRNLVPEGEGPRDEVLERIADRYMAIDCAVFTPNPERLDHIIEMARAYRADGVVHYSLQFCTPYQVESYKVGRALEKEGVPLLKIETDYGM
ncbi:MAG TPA: double-cubane-cluster-containing anaerobic reductase, partial [Deltaproteobacteria bacterium]|nr:double-cubane-cluster-containing anaerobic reductase [Deltaproteobacteria bacterium]